jgi:hypothetical protein
MPLTTRNTFPPGGFPFDQKKADGSIKKFEGLTYGFYEQVMEIKAYREGNGLMPTDKLAIAEELDAFQCERLGFDPLWVTQKKTMPFAATQFSPSHLLRSAKAVAQGASILADWVGEGGSPVDQSLAQKRADACLQGAKDKDGNPMPCPHNREGHAVMKWTVLLAKAVHDQRREKLRLALRVNGEENLHTCDICLCSLALKVFVPFKTIADRTTDVQWKEFEQVPWCWMNEEKKNV